VDDEIIDICPWVLLLTGMLIVGFVAVVSADFGVPGEAGTDQVHLDRPRYVRIADNGSLFISDDHRLAWVENGSVTWEMLGTFCDIELTGTGWAALNGSSSSDCTSILYSNGTTVSLPHRVHRIHRTPSGFVVGGMNQVVTEVDLTGATISNCSFVTGYISDLHLGHYLYADDLYSYDLDGCSSTVVESPAADSVYSFHPMPNGTFVYGLGWNNGSRAVSWGNWTSWITSFPEDLDWNGTALAAVDLNHHVVRVWDLLEEPAPEDGDGDGVLDQDDDCPSVWGNATDVPGCPDRDGDGVADQNDPCPTDPVDGCLDPDGDGWNNTVDDCPGTWGNSTGDRLGCPDRDGDGISDLNDLCPDDPLDLCGDQDGDGLEDGLDDCPSTWGNSTIDRSGCPDRDGDGWSDLVDPCPDDPEDRCDDPPPDPGQLVIISHDWNLTNVTARLVVLLNVTCNTEANAGGEWAGSNPYQWTGGGFAPNQTYHFSFHFWNDTSEIWLNFTDTTLPDADGDGTDGTDGDGDGEDGDGDGEGDLPSPFIGVPGGTTGLLVMVVTVGVAALTIAVVGMRPTRPWRVRRPRRPRKIHVPPPEITDQLLPDPFLDEPTDIDDFDLPLIPKDSMMMEPPAPPVTVAMPYLAIAVAEADQLPGVIDKLRARARMEVCEENQKVLDDLVSVEKRLRQLRDDGDIARRRYDQLLREVEDLRRAVENLTPLMRRD
jgi:hypothetical protein